MVDHHRRPAATGQWPVKFKGLDIAWPVRVFLRRYCYPVEASPPDLPLARQHQPK